MLLDFYDIIHSIILFQLTILIFVLLLKGRSRVSNRLLAFFLFAQLVSSMNAIWWNHNGYTINALPYLGYIAEPFFFVWGPTMFLFIKAQLNSSYRFNLKSALHYLPAILIAIYLLFVFHIKPFSQKIEIIKTGSAFPELIRNNVFNAVIIQVAIYNIISIIRIERFTKKNPVTDSHYQSQMKWNKFILYGYFITCMIYNLYKFVSPHFMSEKTIMNISFLFFSLYFTAILYKSITSNVLSSEVQPLKRRNLLLPESQLEDLASKLELIMMTEKLFLDFDFGLKEMAKRMNVSERLLSQSINTCREQNVNDFINSYRIEEAKKIISENRDPKKTFLEIAYESGFNSKSAFNLVFKNRTGITPTLFKKNNP